MSYLLSFIICGLFCFIAQIVMDLFNLLPLHLTIIYVFLGCLLESFNLYDYLIKYGEGGSMILISNFGHNLAHTAVEEALKNGPLALITGMLKNSSTGMVGCCFFSFLVALVFKPKG